MRERKYKNAAGFTLIEMMVTITIGMIVIAAVTGTFTAQTRQNAAEEQISQMHQNVRGAIDMITRDLMQAGYKASGVCDPLATYSTTQPFPGVAYDPAQLLLKADIDGSGSIDNTSITTLEYIIYAYDSTNKKITRKLGSSGTAELVGDNITQFAVAYKDPAGSSTTVSCSIRKVTITITGQTAKADPSYSSNSGHRTYQLTADITPPNLAL